jgi:hypothetical protein
VHTASVNGGDNLADGGGAIVTLAVTNVQMSEKVNHLLDMLILLC